MKANIIVELTSKLSLRRRVEFGEVEKVERISVGRENDMKNGIVQRKWSLTV